uniref:Alpha-mannosidase n=1 Tax=Hadrurus spadix TaxID=141984 RepID=A0A1W7RA88_9SCOR
MYLRLVIGLLNFVLCLSSSVPKCGYSSCPKVEPDKLNVHIICHTHNDVGWLKTVDQYYYGADSSIQRAGVQYILDSVLDSLNKNNDRRFIYVETAFFWRWWEEQSDDIQNSMKEKIMTGQLEFIGGGWSMNDEAATHYNAMIDQMTWGFRRLYDNFGVCGVPHIGWQIDPFGHSAEQASLFAQMKFDGFFVGRIDYQDKDQREENKQMEFLWQGSQNIGKSGEIFTSVLPNTYSPPSGFCFDLLCNDQPIMDDPRLEDYNVDIRAQEFIKIAKTEATVYRTNNIIMTMGNDFNYQNADTWFKNLDKLMTYINKQLKNESKINVIYSTPSCYLKSVNALNYTWGSKSDDFFPYASDPHAYWTGYFTSRPSVKGYFRQANNVLQVCKQLYTLARLGSKSEDDLIVLREALGVAQHHDAITGTEKQAVTYDYIKQVAKGIDSCQNVMSSAYQKLMQIKKPPPVKQQFCNYLNISACDITENNDLVVVTIYNPIIRNISKYIRFPVHPSGYQVFSPSGKSVACQLVPIPKSVQNIPGRKSNATHELVFKVDLPALGYASYFVKKTKSIRLMKQQHSAVHISFGNTVVLHNKHLTLLVTRQNGKVSAIRRINGQKIKVNQSFYWYHGMNGNNSEFKFRASGAYIFRPNGTDPYPLGDNVTMHIFKGPLVQEIHQIFNSWTTQVIRLYQGEEYIEYEWLVGPIPIQDGIGKEVISRFASELNNKKEFYTDSNGREMRKRIINYRPTWKLNVTEPVSGNYYPVNSRIYIKDVTKGIQVTVLTDRSQGGSSLHNGSLELMIHRRLLHDDAFGVGEALNESGVDGRGLVVRGKHYLIISEINDAAVKHRKLGEELFMAPLMSFVSIESEHEWATSYHTQISGLNRPLPASLHMLTLEPWKNNTVLLRLEHMYEKDDDPNDLSLPVTINFKSLFKAFQVTSFQEATLGANQNIGDVSQLRWSSVEKNSYPKYMKWSKSGQSPLTNITLNPMEIRTFILTVVDQYQ